MDNIFDPKRESKLLEGGDHFWCKTCLTVLPLSDQSTDLDHCHECAKLLHEERKTTHGKESWCRDNTVFVTNGKGWVVGPDCRSYCIGPVDAKGYPVDRHSEPHISGPGSQQAVSKMPDRVSVGRTLVTPIFVTTKRRGRPRKMGKVSRMTEYRRRKELVDTLGRSRRN